MSVFLRQFNGIYYKFFKSKGHVLNHLFRSHAMSFHGIETWFHSLTKQSMRKISVAYHSAVKQICGLNKWDSNHTACNTVGVNIFKHLHARRMISFLFRVFSSCSPCTVHIKNYFRYISINGNNVDNFFRDNYELTNVYRNPLCAIIARIHFIERNEPRLSDLRNDM